MKTALTLIPTLAATTAFAHPGHVAPVAGHSHGEVLAVVAMAVLAIGVFLRMARRG